MATRDAAPIRDGRLAPADGAHFEALADDLDAAVGELLAPVERDASCWTRAARPGKWSAGQHVDHVTVALNASAAAVEKRESRLRDGSLRERPRRGPLEMLWVAWGTRVGWIPRGIRAPAVTLPNANPDATEVKARLRRAVTRHREVGERLAAADRDRLWIGNPFRSRWHYNLPELMRMHAVHVRHHARQVAELADANPGRNA
jgi:hypothetical protein